MLVKAFIMVSSPFFKSKKEKKPNPRQTTKNKPTINICGTKYSILLMKNIANIITRNTQNNFCWFDGLGFI